MALEGISMHLRSQIALLVSVLFVCVIGPVAPCQTGTAEDALTPYMTCSFSDGLQIVRTDPLAPGISRREVDTDQGTRQIEMEAGMRIMFAYPSTDFYANLKAEVLPAPKFAEMMKYLLENFEHLAHGNTVNTAMNHR